MALVDGLLHFWEVEETSGVRVDAHGALNLSDNNTVTSAAGKVGTAAQFTLANLEYLSVASAPSIAFGDEDFTIACWAYFDTIATRQICISKGTVAALDYLLFFQQLGPFFQMFVQNGGSSIAASDMGLSPAADTWYFLVGWHDSVANEVGIQVNVRAPVTSAYTAGSGGTAEPLLIGTVDTPGVLHMDGRLDQIFIYGKVLTSGERAEHYNSGNGLSYADVIGGTHHGRLVNARRLRSKIGRFA